MVVLCKYQSAVPNWLREEIIKNKSVLANAGPNHQNGSSFNSTQSEDAEKPSKGVDQADSKSMESTKSTEDEEDDEVQLPFLMNIVFLVVFSQFAT